MTEQLSDELVARFVDQVCLDDRGRYVLTECAFLAREVQERRQQETAIRAIHYRVVHKFPGEDEPLCNGCCIEWPCPTIRLLDGGER